MPSSASAAPTAPAPAPLSVSVVVPAYDEAAHLGRLLASLAAQDRPPLEVIVADDGSRDATAAIAERHGARVLRLRHRGPAAAKNAGAAAARGDVLAFVDGDFECPPGFLRALVAPIDAGAPGSFTRDIMLANPESGWARGYAALRWSPPDRLLPAGFPDTWANFRAVRRVDFLAAGGYDDVGYGEDMTLAPKLGHPAVVAPGAVCHHHHPASAREVFGNGRWVGRGAAIRTLPHPWRDHALPRVLAIGVRQVVRDRRTAWVLPARLVYHAGVWLGLAETTLRPGRHAR